MRKIFGLLVLMISPTVFSADSHVSGKIVSLAANADNPAIRIDGLMD